MKIRLTNFIAASMVILGISAPIRAETVPNLGGVWYANGSPAARCSIVQSGASLTLKNQEGRTASGTVSGSGTLSTDWGFGGGHITGTISSDLRRINWSNGSFWTRESANFTPTHISVTAAAAVAKPAATPNPWRYIEWSSDTKRRTSPLDVFHGFAAVKRDGTWVTGCFSFENTSRVVAKEIRFTFLLENRNGEIVDKVPFVRKGTFSPNVEIHGYGNLSEMLNRVGHRDYIDNCWANKDGSEEAILRLSRVQYYTYRIERIDFADGTEWPQHNEPTTAPAAPPDSKRFRTRPVTIIPFWNTRRAKLELPRTFER